MPEYTSRDWLRIIAIGGGIIGVILIGLLIWIGVMVTINYTTARSIDQNIDDTQRITTCLLEVMGPMNQNFENITCVRQLT